MTGPLLRRRACGLLLHPTSLPGPHGIGDLGPAAREFLDFLAAGGQSWWQMLPVGPVGAGNSPYSSPSAFAGNPLLISLDMLVSDGLLEPGDLAAPPPFPQGRVDYGTAARFKEPLLRKAFSAFAQRGSAELWEGLRSFHVAHASWLEDYALFSALKEREGGRPWTDWPSEYRLRQFGRWGQEALRPMGEAVAYHQFVQFIFHKQWLALRGYAAQRGVDFIGDVPIFVALDSADVWAHPDIFELGGDGRPTVVSGVPPDYFSETGQLWGNPLYRWEVLRERGYDWWISRLRCAGERFEAVRLDHFIGFARYWEIPAGAAKATEGRWRPGPGEDFFRKAREELPELELIAEDLGSVTSEVEALRDRFEFPGMRVLQFAFEGGDPNHPFLPHNAPRRCVVYTGTHDNDTVAGWFHDPGGAPGRTPESARRERENAMRYLASDGRDIHWEMIRAAYRSAADTAIIPVQDVLGLGTQARMNNPATTRGHWEWRLEPGSLGEEAAGRLEALARESGRQPRGEP